MKKLTKKALALLLAASMTAGLAACGGGSGGKNLLTNEDAKKYVYKMEEMNVDLGDASIRAACVVDGRVYALSTNYYYEEMTGSVFSLYSFNMDGSDLKETELFNTLKPNPDYVQPDAGDEEGVGDEEGAGDEDGMEGGEDAIMPLSAPGIAVPETEEITDEDTDGDENEDTDTDVEPRTEDLNWMEDVNLNTYALNEKGCYMVTERSTYAYDADGNYVPGEYQLEMRAYDLAGNELYRATLNDNAEEYMYVSSMAVDAQGNTAIVTDGESGAILFFDAKGAPVGNVDLASQQIGYVTRAFADKEGRLNILAYDNNYEKVSLYRYNMQTGASEDAGDLLPTITNYNISAGKGYDFFLRDSLGVYGYNVGDEEVTQVLSYLNSDLDYNSINDVYEVDEEHLCCIYYNEEDWSVHFALLTYVDPATIPDKEVISLACFYMDWDLRQKLVEFNRNSDQYRIVVKDYSSYNTMDDYSAGYTRMNNDILTGQIPDIIVLDRYSMPVDSYIAKGLLADIGKMIDEDEELNREDYMENVFDAYSVDGKLYSIIPAFSVQTLAAKTALVGDTPGWTMDDLKALMEKYPDANVFESSYTRDTILSQVLMFSGSKYVENDTGKCHFDSEEFIDMLEFVKQFPEEYDYENDDMMNDYTQYQLQYRNNNTLLASVYFSSFDNWDGYTYARQVQFGEPITMIGFPTDEGNGAVVRAYMEYAISARSQVKEGAWEFLRYYLTEEYQTGDSFYALPVLREALLDKIERSKERPYWIDENGNPNYYDDSFSIGDESFNFVPMSDEEGEALYEYICSVNQPSYYDDNLEKIITEEAAGFFAGQKSAKEVAEIIQSRAQVYINESR